jgi:hypothetical protein
MMQAGRSPRENQPSQARALPSVEPAGGSRPAAQQARERGCKPLPLLRGGAW